MWAEQRHVCAAPPAGPCDGGTCIPAGGGAFGGPVCVMQAGNMTCPPGYQGKKHLVYESGTDERSCGGCTCDLSQVVCNAAADYIVYDDDPDGDGIANNGPCGGMASQIDGCAPLGDKLASAQRAVKPPIVNLSGMKCLGGGSFGQVTGAGPRTICCE